MRLHKEPKGEVLVLSIEGEFDTLDVDRFSAEVSEAVDSGTIRVAVEMSGMTFINSTALGSLLREQKRTQQAGGDLACAALSDFAARNFKLLGLDRKIRVFATVPESVAYLKTVGKEGVGVAGEVQAAFRFPDEEEGRERTAELRDLHEEGLTLVMENLEGMDAEAVFRAGRTVETRFRLPLYHPTHEFRLRGAVGAVDLMAGKRIAARVAFDEVSEVERAAIAKFVEDLKYIRKETGQEERSSS